MDTIVAYLQANIVLVLFLVIGLGSLVGKLKIGSLALGPTTGILIVGLAFGLLHLTVSPTVKGVAFTLFLFVIGISVGPSLVHLLSTRAAFKYLAMSLFAGVAMAVSVFLVAKAFDLNGIVVGGLSAGAMTTSAVLAAGQDMIAGGAYKLPDGMSLEAASDLMAGAYALTYLFGTFGLILLVKICPRLVGKDIAEEAAKLESDAGANAEMVSASIRAWKVTAPDYIGKTIADLEAGAAKHEAEHGIPTLIEKVLRDGKLLEPSPDLKLKSGDVVAAWATPGILVFGTKVLGEEVTDPKVLSVKLASSELVVTNRKIVGKTLGEFVREHGRGVTVERMARTGNELPVRGDTPIVAGDVLFASGPQRQLDAFAEQVGYVVEDQLKTDLINLGIFLALFGALGTITVTIAGVKLAVLGGAAMGAMLGGVILGWLRSRSPRWGSVAAPAGDALMSLSLGLFIACVAIGAGGTLIELLQTQGPKLILAGAIVTTFCTIATFLFGHFVLRLNVAYNSGATYGAMTGAAPDEFCKDARSSAPAVAYALPSAVSNLIFIVVALVLMTVL
ncbi:Aspartate/alanine antiporter [Microbulbifer aggregans]|uniref:Aspartate/alanine antiporter n=1 Tax=Microbulbifer aggregans TaxID=1769779 RepID=A0A1C9W8Z7_9GAMM|nr:TrkA C-terminal domain-containing protein [Microbulbifer aggregans]AOS97585.1 Aspartate/alanine antiporter [Microbulbifer aggregans]